jgi:hypothetical protein
VRLKRGGTSLREKAGFKGKQANEVGTQLMKRERSQLAQRYYHVTKTFTALHFFPLKTSPNYTSLPFTTLVDISIFPI